MSSMNKKRKQPEFRSIKVHAEVYAALRERQADIVRDGWEAWGMQFAMQPTLSAVISAALMSMRVKEKVA
jgi:hypothetical protein